GGGFACLWAIGIHLLTPPYGGGKSQDWQYVEFRSDGTPLINSASGYHDLEGNVVHVSLKDSERFIGPSDLAANADRSAGIAVEPWSWRLAHFVDSAKPLGFWFLVCGGKHHGRACLVGYDSQSYARLGYLGKTGFRQDEPPPDEQFPLSQIRSQSAAEERYYS